MVGEFVPCDAIKPTFRRAIRVVKPINPFDRSQKDAADQIVCRMSIPACAPVDVLPHTAHVLTIERVEPPGRSNTQALVQWLVGWFRHWSVISPATLYVYSLAPVRSLGRNRPILETIVDTAQRDSNPLRQFPVQSPREGHFEPGYVVVEWGFRIYIAAGISRTLPRVSVIGYVVGTLRRLADQR